MPGGDRTGPRGEGPLTGRGMGNCVNNVNVQNGTGLGPCGNGMPRGMGRGLGRGMGRGRGPGRGPGRGR